MAQLIINSSIDSQFSELEKSIISKALEFLLSAVNHELFKMKVISFKQKNGEPGFFMNEGKTNEQIYSYIMSGADKFDTSANYDLDLNLTPFKSEDFKSGGGMLGYVRSNQSLIHLNTEYIKGNPPVIAAGIIMHEYMHNLGFNHDKGIGPLKKLVKNHDDTVPYAIGFIIMDICNAIFVGSPGYVSAREEDIKTAHNYTFTSMAKGILDGI